MEFSRDTNSCIQPQEYERYEKVVMDAKGNLKVVPLRRGKGDSAFIDTISFTFHE
ncbi:TPA: replication initiation factor domain-containing protein, partial [Neisseria meningitidis]